jgi:amidase
MLRCNEISSRELTEELLARIDSVNPALNAVVELRREAALQEATTADEAITFAELFTDVIGGYELPPL